MSKKSTSPRLRQDQIPKEFGCSSSTLQRYRQDINMLSPYKNPPNNHRRRQKILNREHDLEKTQITSNDLKMTSENLNEKSKKVKTKQIRRWWSK